MSDMTCPRCHRRTADGLLCDGCLGYGRDQLGVIAEHWSDLLVHKSGGGSASKGFGVKLPASDHDVKVISYVRNQLQTWVRDLDMGDTDGLADDPAEWAQWLAARTQRIRTHAAGDEAIDEFDYCAGLVIGAINPRRTRTGCGECPICGDDVFAIDDEPTGTCTRCAEAGVTSVMHRLSQRQDLWDRVPDTPLPRRLLMEALPMYGIHVKPSTFRQWVFQGRLRPVGERNGAPLYLVSHVQSLVKDAGRGTVTASA